MVPILNDKFYQEILSSVAMFRQKGKWRAWGMNSLREQGAAILFHGKPGTGKTLTATHLAEKLKMELFSIDFSQVGSDKPGHLARNIKGLFEAAAVRDVKDSVSMVFIDECDTMLVDRRRLGATALWMLEPINALLSAIGKYEGLVVLATNASPDFLDPALERRLLGSFEFQVPEFLTRVKLWKQKWPRKLPCGRPADEVFELLARGERTGAEIENLIIHWVSEALTLEVDPRVDKLLYMVGEAPHESIFTQGSVGLVVA